MLRVEIPDGVDDRRQRHVDDALLGPEPAQLRIGRQRAPEPREVGRDAVERQPDDVGPNAAIAAAQRSFPRPIVKARPCPSRWPSVRRITYAAE